MNLLIKYYSPWTEGGGIPDEDAVINKLKNDVEDMEVWVDPSQEFSALYFNEAKLLLSYISRLKAENERLRGEPDANGVVSHVKETSEEVNTSVTSWLKGEWVDQSRVEKPKIWEMVKSIEEGYSTTQKPALIAAEIRSTLLINFGQTGRFISGVIDENYSTLGMLVKVLETLIAMGDIKKSEYQKL